MPALGSGPWPSSLRKQNGSKNGSMGGGAHVTQAETSEKHRMPKTSAGGTLECGYRSQSLAAPWRQGAGAVSLKNSQHLAQSLAQSRHCANICRMNDGRTEETNEQTNGQQEPRTTPKGSGGRSRSHSSRAGSHRGRGQRSYYPQALDGPRKVRPWGRTT